MRKLLLTLAVLSVMALVAAGCGSENEAASGASELVPAGALMYGEATLDPEGDQKQAIDSILAKFPGGGQAGDKLKELIEKALRESDAPVNFNDDIEPWLGDEAAFFASSVDSSSEPSAAVALVATDDEDKALETLEKSAEGELTRKNYKDVEYLTDESDEAGAVLDGFLVLGTEAGVKAVIDTSKGGKKLSDDENYKNALDGASEDRLGLFYLNSPQFLKSAQATMALPQPAAVRAIVDMARKGRRSLRIGLGVGGRLRAGRCPHARARRGALREAQGRERGPGSPDPWSRTA